MVVRGTMAAVSPSITTWNVVALADHGGGLARVDHPGVDLLPGDRRTTSPLDSAAGIPGCRGTGAQTDRRSDIPVDGAGVGSAPAGTAVASATRTAAATPVISLVIRRSCRPGPTIRCSPSSSAVGPQQSQLQLSPTNNVNTLTWAASTQPTEPLPPNAEKSGL